MKPFVEVLNRQITTTIQHAAKRTLNGIDQTEVIKQCLFINFIQIFQYYTPLHSGLYTRNMCLLFRHVLWYRFSLCKSFEHGRLIGIRLHVRTLLGASAASRLVSTCCILMGRDQACGSKLTGITAEALFRALYHNFTTDVV